MHLEDIFYSIVKLYCSFSTYDSYRFNLLFYLKTVFRFRGQYA